MNKIKWIATAMAAGAAAFGVSAALAAPTEGRWAFCFAQHGLHGAQYSVSKLFRPMAEPGWFDSQGDNALEGPAEAFKAAVEAEQRGRSGSKEDMRIQCVNGPSFYAISDSRTEKLEFRSTRVIEWPASNAILVASPATEAPLAIGAAENAQHLLVYTLGQMSEGERSHDYMAPELKKGVAKAAVEAAQAAGPVQDVKLLRADPDGHVFEVKHANAVKHWKVSQKNLMLTGISQAAATGQ